MALQYRIASIRDAEQLADCAAEALVEDELFAALHPGRHTDLNRFRTHLKRRARSRLTDHTYVTLVAEEKGRIIGFAHWQKLGPGTTETRWDPLKACERRLMAFEDWILSFFEGADPTVDLAASAAISSEFTELERLYWKNEDGTDREHWHLRLLAVHPTGRRRGIGGNLVQQGIDRARRDGCDAGLESSPMGLSVYQAKGFKVVGRYEMLSLLDAEGQPMEAPVLLWRNPDIASM
ncbi:hypothetical protein DRE_03445 [Drechslerella stenobrocha 248]|uniref:N-acetyltransferase domain-containing protein n=1 Tax=Drechslerella stenobrocha 248 TaxID=1043628 RepID=W7HSQ2_9PEZI|nr:hypothetical protein DRE_03445 [Drechslerella stenobrocha 248]